MQLSVHQGQWRSSRASVCCRVLLLYRNWYTILGGLFSGLEWERFTTALECLTEVESRFELPPLREWIPVAAAVEDTLEQPEPSRLFLAPTEDEVTSIELSRGISGRGRSTRGPAASPLHWSRNFMVGQQPKMSNWSAIVCKNMEGM